MASVCGASLALMDAGVPVKAPVAGIAMGLVKEGEKFAVLTDILGDEDHLGDMDFKVAGTDKGVTALQMDIKINGITEEIMEIALGQALEARLNILGQMNQVIAKPRAELSENAPTMLQMKIDSDKIRDVIGKGGATIRGICEETKASIDIEDDGSVKIYGETKRSRRGRQAARPGDHRGKPRSARSTSARWSASSTSVPSSTSCRARTAWCTSRRSATSASTRSPTCCRKARK